jgi:FMN phosphatase YigB (HAD superfamily)
MDESFFEGFNKDLHVQALWEEFYTREQTKNPKFPKDIPPLPKVNGEWLFNQMMGGSVNPDPWMFPALQALKSSGKYILGALSNTVIFRPGHRLHQEDFYSGPVKSCFDVFVSSAHVGQRKPEPRIYANAVSQLDQYAKDNAQSSRNNGLGWENGVKPEEVLFLDDIGENLKAGKNAGFKTIKVNLGRAYEAVEELERITGLQLEGDHPKIAIKPRLTLPKSRI